METIFKSKQQVNGTWGEGATKGWYYINFMLERGKMVQLTTGSHKKDIFLNLGAIRKKFGDVVVVRIGMFTYVGLPKHYSILKEMLEEEKIKLQSELDILENYIDRVSQKL